MRQGSDVVGGRDVAHLGRGGGAELCGHLREGRLAATDQDDAQALVHQAARHHGAEAAATAGDDGEPADQVVHLLPAARAASIQSNRSPSWRQARRSPERA